MKSERIGDLVRRMVNRAEHEARDAPVLPFRLRLLKTVPHESLAMVCNEEIFNLSFICTVQLTPLKEGKKTLVMI